MNPRYRFALALTLALLFLLPFLTRKGHDSAYAAAPTAGQLAVLDHVGRVAALCPLQHTDVVADVAGFVARVSVTQRFHNPSREPVEAMYTFPLPADAAVDDMTMTIGDRVIRGEIKRKEEARRIYEEARTEGRTAALLDQERPNIFTQSVANMMPGKDVSITISYVHLLKYEAGKYEFVFPMVVGPRFVPDSGGYQAPGVRGNPSSSTVVEGDPGATSVVTDASKITPPITPPGVRAGHDISVTVKLDAGVTLEDVKSELHAVKVDREGATRATVRLKDENTIPNKDFILHYAVAGKEVKTGLLTHAEKGQGYFTLIFQPPTAPPPADVAPKEMVFVIDQTGSQSGWPIKKAKETMRYCIRQLNPDDTFQLIGFNTDVFPCFPAPVRNTPENVAQALKFLAPIEGEGGTDILKSVDYALRIPADPKRLRMICYLSDGYVGNDMQVLDYVGKHRGTTRMFPMGIGNSVNRFLIDGMAREGRGAAEFVTLEEGTGEAAAGRFYHRVAQPVLLDPRVDWGGLPVADVFPNSIPDVFTAGPIIVKGRYTRGAEGDITISGTLRGQPWSQKVHVVLPADRAEDAALPTLWAREKIEDLQRQDWIGAQTGRPNGRIKDQIVGVALDYRLMSQYTSFVAVEQRIVNLGGKQRTLDVPVELPEGVSYEGIFGPAGEGENKQQADDGIVSLGKDRPRRVNPFAPSVEFKSVTRSSGETARRSRAMSNLRQLGNSFERYANDYDDTTVTLNSSSVDGTLTPISPTLPTSAAGPSTSGAAQPRERNVWRNVAPEPQAHWKNRQMQIGGGYLPSSGKGATAASPGAPSSAAVGARASDASPSTNVWNGSGNPQTSNDNFTYTSPTPARTGVGVTEGAPGLAGRAATQIGGWNMLHSDSGGQLTVEGHAKPVTTLPPSPAPMPRFSTPLSPRSGTKMPSGPAPTDPMPNVKRARPRKGAVTVRADEVMRSPIPQIPTAQTVLIPVDQRLSPALLQLASGHSTAGGNAALIVTDGKVAVQIWVARMPRDGLAKLQKLGFQNTIELRPGLVWVGMAPVNRLKELAALPWVFRIEPPKLR